MGHVIWWVDRTVRQLATCWMSGATGRTHVSFVWLGRQVNEWNSWKLRETGHIQAPLSFCLPPSWASLFVQFSDHWESQAKRNSSLALFISPINVESLFFFSSEAEIAVIRSDCERFQGEEKWGVSVSMKEFPELSMTVLRSLASLFCLQSGTLFDLLCVFVKILFVHLRSWLAYVIFGSV